MTTSELSAAELAASEPNAARHQHAGEAVSVVAVQPSPARRHASFGGGTPALTRHPSDGWTLADPFPLGEPARAALRGLARVLCPPEPAPQLPDLEDRIERETRTLLRYMPLPVAWILRLVFRLVDQAPRLLLVSRRRLHMLDVEHARAIVHRLAESRVGLVREIVGLPRSVVLSIYFDQDEVHQALGYAPIPFMRSRIALRRRLVSGEPHTPSDIIPVGAGLDP